MIRLTILALLLVSASASAKKNPSPADNAKAFVDAHNAVRSGVGPPAGYGKPWQPGAPA